MPPPLSPGPLLLLPGALPAPAPPGVIEAARRAYGQAGIPAGAPAVSWVLAESRRWGLRLPVWLPPLSPTVVQMAWFWGLTGCLGVQGGSGPGFRLSVPALLPPQAPLPVLPPCPPSQLLCPPIQLCCGTQGAVGQPVGLMGQLQGLRTGRGVALSCMGDVAPRGWSCCCSSGHMRRGGGPPIKCFHGIQKRPCEMSKVLCIPPHVSLTKPQGGQIAFGLQGFSPALGKDPWKARGQQQVWGVCTVAPVPPGKILPGEGEF